MAMYGAVSGQEISVRPCPTCNNPTNKDERCNSCGTWFCGSCADTRNPNGYAFCPNCGSDDATMRWQME